MVAAGKRTNEFCDCKAMQSIWRTSIDMSHGNVTGIA